MRAAAYTKELGRLPERSPIPGIALMTAVLIVAVVLFALNSDFSATFPYLYILPWIIGLSVVFAAPVVYLHQVGRLVIYDPIVFAVISYLFPAFVIGGIMLMTGWSQPGILSLIEDPTYNLPYTIVLVALGFVGMTLGYFVPVGAALGRAIEIRLPRWEFAPEQFIVPGIALLLIGIANVSLAFVLGVIGFQRTAEITGFDGLIFVTTSLWSQATFLLMYSLFRRKKYDFLFFLITFPVFLAALGKALLSGNRGSLLQIAFILGLAFFFSGAKLSLRRGLIAGIILTIALIAGMIYGTTFRNIKESESRVSMGRYSEIVSSTFDDVGKTDLSDTMSFAFSSTAVRLDSLSSLSVVVSNYEQMAPYEEGYGLDNNIWRDLSTFAVPRFIWRDKPSETDPRRYSDLYFNYSESSFVITPFGDLIRNFGPLGVPIGLFLFGIVLRTIYRALVEDQKLVTWRVAVYFIILTTVSYEGFFSTLIPNITKFGVTAIVGVSIVYFVARFLGYSKIEAA